MNNEILELNREMEKRMIAENQREEKRALVWWWAGLVLCALLNPGFDNRAIFLVGALGAGAAFISGIMLVCSRKWVHLILGVIAFIGIGYLADHSWQSFSYGMTE